MAESVKTPLLLLMSFRPEVHWTFCTFFGVLGCFRPCFPDIIVSCFTTAVSILASVKFCFWMFGGQWEHVSDLTAMLLSDVWDRFDVIDFFLWGPQLSVRRAHVSHLRRVYESNSIFKLFNLNVFFNFNSMSQADGDGRDQTGRWSPGAPMSSPSSCQTSCTSLSRFLRLQDHWPLRSKFSPLIWSPLCQSIHGTERW